MSSEIRLSASALKVLKVFVERPRDENSGADISKLAAIGSGTLYPLLARFEAAGWFESRWESVEPSEVGRPRRRLYKLTAVGQRNALKAFSEFELTAGAFAWN